MSDTNSESDLLGILERVFLQFGSADTDEQLEATIKKFLLLVLFELNTQNVLVRDKIMELLAHVNKRIRRSPAVQLPVEGFLCNYINGPRFLINFLHIYIKMGYPRLPPEQKDKYVRDMLIASGKHEKVHQNSFLYLLTHAINDIKVPDDETERKNKFLIHDMGPMHSSELLDDFIKFMLDVLLLPYDHIKTPIDENTGWESLQPPPGMSMYGFKRVVVGKPAMTPETLEQVKLGILKFITSGITTNEEIICHLIIAASDTRFTVANLADTELKRIAGSVDWSNAKLAHRLFTIYLGSSKVPLDKRSSRVLLPLLMVAPANTRIRLKMLPYLSRLEKNAIQFTSCVQVIFNTLKDGNLNPKLQLLAMNFALAIVRRADDSQLKKMGGIMYAGLRKFVFNKEESVQLRVVGYTIIGQIVKRMPEIINQNLSELQSFFENLSCDQSDIRVAVRDALLTMMDAFRLFMKSREAIDGGGEKMELDGEDAKTEDGNKAEVSADKESIIGLLSSQIESQEPMARFVAVKYAATVFDQNHVQSRYLLLLAVGDPNSDVSSIATKSLYAGLENDGRESVGANFPNFVEMSSCIYEKAKSRMSNPSQAVTIRNAVSPFNEITFNEILTYLRLCLAKSSSIDVKSKELMIHPCDNSPEIGRYIASIHRKDPAIFENYINMIEMLLSPSCSMIPIGCLVELIGTCPEIFAKRFAPKLDLIMNMLGNTKEDVRESIALLLSTLAIHTLDDSQLTETIKTLVKKLEGNSVENQHGALLSLGHIVERRRTIRGKPNDRQSCHVLEGEIVLELAKHLESSHGVLISASCTALGEILKSGPSFLPDEHEMNLSKRGLMNKLLKIVNNNKLSSKIREKGVQTCGMMCLGEDFPFVKELIEQFLSISKQTKDIDSHFSIGESIILCLEGTSSSSKRDLWKLKESEFQRPDIPDGNVQLLNWLLNELITTSALPHPNTRQSVCVYLLSIIKKMSYSKSVRDNLPAIQNVFMELLSENNELVQDIASKGLALVYENTTESNKKELVTKLLDQLLSGKRAVQQVSSDTKLFEEGQLGTSPSGGNLSTYKELCSLASELNQPDLIYKFMHLANHNAVWNSKKGAAFGFHNIALHANDQINEYLPKIVPRLYRYQYDPTPRIQQSMANIWHSLVKDTQKTIDKYYSEILDDLILNLTSNQWRVRISCCLALADFFRGSRSILDAKQKLSSLWQSLFRVMDDVHEGTRLAAQNTGKILAKLCVKVCDTSVGKVNDEMLQLVLSIFLSGITNTVAEVRNLCLLTVSQLVNSAGSSLKPNLVILMVSLLEAAGELESVGLSYLSAQYGARSQTQDMIDSVRANVAKSHFTTQTVTKCVEYVELEMLETLVPKVVELMKSVNLGSKIACSHLIVLLSHHLGKSMNQYTGKFLAALVNGLLDRNTAVRKTFASTIGQILQTAKPTSLEKLFGKLSTWYFEKDDLNTRTAIGQTLQASAHYNGELLKDYSNLVIPLVFFAMHAKKTEGEDNSHVTMWEDIWNDVSVGYESSIRQHMTWICKIIEDAFASSSWTMKAQGGNCVQTIAIKAGENLAVEDRDRLIDLLLQGLQGKTFPGKEEIVKGLAKLCSHSSDQLKKSEDKCRLIVDALLRECGKSDPAYKRKSMEALGTVLETFDNMDFFRSVYELSRGMIQRFDELREESDTTEEVNQQRNERYSTMEVTYVSLGKSWPKNKLTQLEYQDVILSECCDALETSPRDIQVAILSALHSYVEKLHYFLPECKPTGDEEEKHLTEILGKLTAALHFSLGIAKHTRLRKEALNVVTTLSKKLSATGRNRDLRNFADSLSDCIKELEKDGSPEVRTRLTDVKELFRES